MILAKITEEDFWKIISLFVIYLINFYHPPSVYFVLMWQKENKILRQGYFRCATNQSVRLLILQENSKWQTEN